MSGSFVFLDFETTGLDDTSDRVIEVAAIRYTYSGQELDRYHTLVNPGVPVPSFITDLTGIDTTTVVRMGIDPSTAFERLLHFFQSDTVAAFNADFDMRFLMAEAKRAGLTVEGFDYCCALTSAQKAWPVFRRHSLKALSMFFDLPEQKHRALSDCYNGSRIFIWSMSATSKNNITDCLQLGQLCVTSLDIEALYSCKDGDQLALWTKPDFPRVNAYAPGSIAGSGLVASLSKEKNGWLLEQMNAGIVEALVLRKKAGQGYEILPVSKDAQPIHQHGLVR